MKKNILVVDDVGGVCRELRFLLEDEGYSVFTVGNGDDALFYVKTEPVDLVITDVLMPEMDGIELCNALRRIDPSIPIVVMSGGGNLCNRPGLSLDSLLSQVKKLSNAKAVIKKPFKSEEILKVVNEAFVFN